MLRTLLILISTLSCAALATEIPAGTPITVRMVDSVDSRTNAPGTLFQATVDEAVMVNGKTAIPKGTRVETKLVEVKQAGRLTGKSELSLTLAAINYDGNTYDVSSSEMVMAGKSKTKSTGLRVGAGAALGALVGGIFGGGKGAAAGAITGGAAGGTYSVMTKGEAVRIPSETRLKFTLGTSLTI